MGTFLFKWEHPASEVYVTGTFDDWAKSVKLEKKGDSFEKELDLPQTEDKIYYKFVVDGTWTTDHTAPQENDGANNVNNVLTPDRLSKLQSPSDPSSHMMSGVTPQSTTAQLAGQVPKESERGQDAPNTASSDLPGTFPETPGPNEVSEFGVNPKPATSGTGNPVNLKPGEKVPDSSTLTDNTINSTVRNDNALSKSADDSEKTFGVSPLPATSGIGNPIHLQPGEKVPDSKTFTENTVQSTARTDPESYEQGQGAPQLPNVVTPPNEREAEGGMFNLPGISKNMIPESSLPMGGQTSSEKDPGFTIQSAGAGTTTAALAGNVPKEPRGVPQVVQNSPQQAGNEQYSTTESAGAATTSLPSRGVPQSVQQSIDEMNSSSAIAPTVPDVVQESITEAHQSPEAAGSKNMVAEKRNVETELLKGTDPVENTGEPAPATSASLTESAPAATTSDFAKPDTSSPAVTTTSTQPNTAAPEDPRSIPTTTTTAPTEPAAPTSSDVPAMTAAAENAMKRDAESRDISPMTRPDGTQAQTQPAVTSGVKSSTAPTSSKATGSRPAAASKEQEKADKSKKRGSGFFGRLKQKFGGQEIGADILHYDEDRSVERERKAGDRRRERSLSG